MIKTVKRYAEESGLSEGSVRNLINNNSDFPAIKQGRTWIVEDTLISEWFKVHNREHLEGFGGEYSR